MSLMLGAIVLVVGIALPVSILVLARTQSVREYYDPTE